MKTSKLLIEADRFLWKYFCRFLINLSPLLIPVKWIPLIIFGASGALPCEAEVKEEKIKDDKQE